MTERILHNWQGRTAFLIGRNTYNHMTQEKLAASLGNNFLFRGYRDVEKMVRTEKKGEYVMFPIETDEKKYFMVIVARNL